MSVSVRSGDEGRKFFQRKNDETLPTQMDYMDPQLGQFVALKNSHEFLGTWHSPHIMMLKKIREGLSFEIHRKKSRSRLIISYYYKLKYKIHGGFQLVIGLALFHHPFSFGIVHERFTIQPFGATPMTEETSWVDRELITANDEWLPRSSQMFPCLMTPDFSNTYSIHIWWLYGGFLSGGPPS